MLKIAYIGSNPVANSGFGVVSRYLLSHLHADGLELVCLGYLEEMKHFDPGQFPYFIEPVSFENTMEEHVLKNFCLRHKPDVILLHDEINVCKWWMERIRKQPGADVPIISYMPIYGEPIAYSFMSFLQELDAVIAYTDYGKKVIEKYANIPAEFAYLGVDHSFFYQYDRDLRKEMRDYVGWSDKFVVMFVSRNRQNKQHTKLIKAIAMMKKMKYEDIVCYIHSHPTEEYSLYGGGVDLTEWVKHADLANTVFFPDEMKTQEKGIPLVKQDFGGKVPIHGGTREQLQRFGLAERYNLADFYIHLSLSEGFGLPLVEAMATGLPLAHTDDGGVMNEVSGKAGYRMNPVKKERDVLGTICSSVTTAAVFGTLKKFYHEFREGTRWQEMSKSSLKRTEMFSWEKTAARVKEVIQKCHDRGCRGR